MKTQFNFLADSSLFIEHSFLSCNAVLCAMKLSRSFLFPLSFFPLELYRNLSLKHIPADPHSTVCIRLQN